MNSTQSLIPPPTALEHDDPSVVETARLKVTPKSRWFSKNLKSRPRIRSLSTTAADTQQDITESTLLSSNVKTVVTIDLAEHNREQSDHIYRWAYLDENQRGIILFSTPYFSASVLFPFDPLPFTIPTGSEPIIRSHHPDVSLKQFPLPNGEWEWVSNAWMIDMRSSDTVQYDGFEYNIRFKGSGWHPIPGSGSFVRRRRWMRLARRKPKEIESVGWEPEDDTGASISIPSDMLSTFHDPDRIWKGDDIDSDWRRCCNAMRKLVRDSHKVDIWSVWLGVRPAEPDTIRREWTEDDHLKIPEASHLSKTPSVKSEVGSCRQPIADVLKTKLQDLFGLFIYPDSRVQLLDILMRSGLMQEYDIKLPGGLAQALDFWSYASNIEDGVQTEAQAE